MAKRFLTDDMKEEIDYIVENMNNSLEKNELRNELYNECELFLRAKFKLKDSELFGTNQQYQSKLNTLLNTIIKTSSFIEAPLEFKIPASYPAIVDNFIYKLRDILGWDDNTTDTNIKYILGTIENTKDYKLRKSSESYDIFLNKIMDLEEEFSLDEFDCGSRVTPSIGYYLLIFYTILL
jgi:hypothetical protein